MPGKEDDGRGQLTGEVMGGLAEEVGLDKFSDIVDHFLGRITVEKIENETPEDDEGQDDMYYNKGRQYQVVVFKYFMIILCLIHNKS